MPEEQGSATGIQKEASSATSCRDEEPETLTLTRSSHKSQGQCTQETNRNLSRSTVLQGALQWEAMMKTFSQAHKERCMSVPEDLPLINRSIKTFPTGSTYSGTWNTLGMSGEGTYTFPHKGVVYKGGFDDGAFHGDGTLYYECGAIVQGKWNKGKLAERHLFFADGLEYVEDDWAYCRPFDRRFTVEYDNGLEPANLTYKTADQPTPPIPDGLFDVGSGLYDPVTKTVYKYNDLTSIERTPDAREAKWIENNCRTSPDLPKGPCPFLYEQWLTPTEELVPEPPPILRCHTNQDEEPEPEVDVTERPSDTKQSKLRPKGKLFASRIGFGSKTDFYNPDFIYSKLEMGAPSGSKMFMELSQIQSKEIKKDVEFLPLSGTRLSPRSSEIPKRRTQKASSVAFRAWKPESVSQTTAIKVHTQDSDIDDKLMSTWGLTSASTQKRSDMEYPGKEYSQKRLKMEETSEFAMRKKYSSSRTSIHEHEQDSEDYYKSSRNILEGRGQSQTGGDVSTQGLISQSEHTEVVEDNEANAQDPDAGGILSTQGLTSRSEHQQNAEDHVQGPHKNIKLVQDPESGNKNISTQGLISQSIHEPPVAPAQ